MTERHLIAYAILFVVLLAGFVLWRRRRRVRRAPEPHLKIDLVGSDAEGPGPAGP